jgi:hypothetical protein
MHCTVTVPRPFWPQVATVVGYCCGTAVFVHLQGNPPPLAASAIACATASALPEAEDWEMASAMPWPELRALQMDCITQTAAAQQYKQLQ